jgi:hypothetical protein
MCLDSLVVNDAQDQPKNSRGQDKGTHGDSHAHQSWAQIGEGSRS